MPLKYNDEQRREYLNMTDRIGINWVGLFHGNTEFYSAVYWDLLTGIWRQEEAVRKTDAMNFMKSVKSAHTAGKYIDNALKQGILVEEGNPEDARSKLVMLSPRTRENLDTFFDLAVSELRRSNHSVNVKGPSPEEP
ncbi:MAG TPA: hypothetical protein QF509_03065 [Rhodospirillales bacterium]|nr:hypothetical protein [Rhodospirillales bacterium]